MPPARAVPNCFLTCPLQRPELHAPIIHFDVLWPDFVSPGYIFLSPYRNVDPGPYIYDNYGVRPAPARACTSR